MLRERHTGKKTANQTDRQQDGKTEKPYIHTDTQSHILIEWLAD